MNSYNTAPDLRVITYKQDFLVYVIFFVIGIVMTAGGFGLKNYYEYEDSLRTVTNVPAKINKITKYEVTYVSNRGVQPTTVYNVNPNAVKSVGDVYSFDIKNSSNSNVAVNSQMLPITEVRKKADEIEVEFTQNGMTRKGYINKTYFTRELNDSDVSKMINIEFSPNDMKVIAMSVEGLTSSQFFYCWTLISVGIIMIFFCLYMIYGILFPPPKK